MGSISPELKSYQKMRNIFRRLTAAALSLSFVGVLLSAYMFYLATPPHNSDYAAYEKWLTDHQEQFLMEQSGTFYWSEIHSAMLFGGIAVFLLLVGLFSAHMLVVARVAKITAKAVLVDTENGPVA